MRFILIAILSLIFGCESEIKTIKLPGPDLAKSKAIEYYKKNGHSPISIVSNGEQYFGKAKLDQKIIQCALRDKDIKLFVLKIESIKDENAQKYADLYNTKMMELLAKDRDCFNEK